MADTSATVTLSPVVIGLVLFIVAAAVVAAALCVTSLVDALHGIGRRLDQLAVLKAEENAVLRQSQIVTDDANKAIKAANAAITVSNERATWYQAELATLRSAVGQLQTKVQRLDVLQ